MHKTASLLRSSVGAALFLFFLQIGPAVGKTYYIDGSKGADGNAGTSTALAWKTLAPASRKSFSPGDSLLLRRGSIYTQGLKINSTGSGSKPIVVGAWGTGAAPMVRNDSGKSCGIQLQAPAIVESLLVRGTGSSAIFVTKYADGSTVRYCEACSCGVGIELQGRNCLAKGNYIHDMIMVVNTPGGDDDYGAVGVIVENSRNQVCNNRMVNCKAPSYDYNTDGGVVELYGNCDSCLIYSNIGQNCDGFTEIGGGSAKNSRIAYNISVNNGPFVEMHLRGSFISTVQNLQVDNNTVFDTIARTTPAWAVIGFDGNPTASTLVLRNNIIEAKRFSAIVKADNATGWSFSHKHNLYYVCGTSTPIGYTLDSTERIANPLFANVAAADFHLQPGSPAIDAGITMGDSTDFYGKPVTGQPSLGAVDFSTSGVQKSAGAGSAVKLVQKNPLRISHSGTVIAKDGKTFYSVQGRRITTRDLHKLD